MVDLFERMEKHSEQVLKEMKENAIAYCRRNKVGDTKRQSVGEHGVAVCLEAVDHLIDNLDLEIPNADWDWLSGKGKPIMYEHNKQPLRHNMVKHEMGEIIQRDLDSAEYDCDKGWEVQEKPTRRPLSKGERMGEQMFDELVAGPRREAANALADEDERRKESGYCKDAMKDFTRTYRERMEKRIPELR